MACISAEGRSRQVRRAREAQAESERIPWDHGSLGLGALCGEVRGASGGDQEFGEVQSVRRAISKLASLRLAPPTCCARWRRALAGVATSEDFAGGEHRPGLSPLWGSIARDSRPDQCPGLSPRWASIARTGWSPPGADSTEFTREGAHSLDTASGSGVLGDRLNQVQG